MNNRAIKILQDGVKTLQEELKQVDASIASLQSTNQQADRSDPAVAMLTEGRLGLQHQIDELKRTIERLDGEVTDPAYYARRPVATDQWSRLRLPEAFRVYASERGDGPFPVTLVAKDLLQAGVRVVMTRSRFSKDKARELDARDIRLLGANNPVLYDYDRLKDTIRLRSEEEAKQFSQQRSKKGVARRKLKTA